MHMSGKASLAAIAAVAAALAPSAARAGEPVDIELVLAVDVSGSVDGAELALQREGLAAAFRDPEVIDAITALPRGVGVALVVWAGVQETAVAWRRLTDSASAEDFAARVEAALPSGVQALALAWTRPYRVACMSVTTAFAFGFDPAFCAEGCRRTRPSPYFDSPSAVPFHDLHVRPAMLLAGSSVAHAKATIDRGVAADGTFPPGTAYLLSTSDRARNARASRYGQVTALSLPIRVRRVDADELRDVRDVLFYFTGLKSVAGLETLRFRPGAIADHLTSTGGVLDGADQMSALRWLDAGATASYGAVIEPCNFAAKFPQPAVVIARYTHGESLIEAYWKSVAWPGQGVFVGEPLAAPFRRR